MTFANSNQTVDVTTNSFDQLSVDDQLALLWFIYTRMGDSVTPAAPAAASPEIASGLFQQIADLEKQEQLQAMRDIASKADTRISREYGSLSANTKLAFWYRLAQGMDTGTIIGVPADYKMTEEADRLLGAIETMDFEQQITILRNAALEMGAEPKAGAAV
ncbi:orange carotenoid protein N-terminal domain-containing protein [Vacuolonema iberomarrocanum]|uniref:orange carotenoid protein N-terminal domain-containing protein n=1 Tax=Vacuolonema iberomarrocanum TaxID=3454632 RepID=UPI0019E9BCB1|nr:Orange carotenoid protein [filamentous cyanobacterium LEGE 07170]